MRLRGVTRNHEILDPVVEDRIRPAGDFETRFAFGPARKLFFDQGGMVEVKMDITAHPNGLARLKVALLGEHPRQQGQRPHVEGFSGHPLFRPNHFTFRWHSPPANFE